jgi:hypothetical protein
VPSQARNNQGFSPCYGKPAQNASSEASFTGYMVQKKSRRG